MMQDFLNAAFPWMILGTALAVVLKLDDNKKKK